MNVTQKDVPLPWHLAKQKLQGFGALPIINQELRYPKKKKTCEAVIKTRPENNTLLETSLGYLHFFIWIVLFAVKCLNIKNTFLISLNLISTAVSRVWWRWTNIRIPPLIV